MAEEHKERQISVPKNTSFTQPKTVEVQHTVEDEEKYLMNVGEPTLKTIRDALYNSWMTIEGKKYNVMVIWPVNRNSDLPWEEKDDSYEARMAKQLQLKITEKAYVYFDPEYGANVPERGWSKVLYVKDKVAINHSFTVQHYPHILDYPIGEGGIAGERQYTIKVGQITKVTNRGDFIKLWETFGFLDEVNEEGEVIKKNIFSEKKKNPDQKVDTRGYNPNMASEPEHRDLPSEHKENMKRLKTDNLGIKEASKLSDLDTVNDKEENK